jgi:site-specific recombinase XerD
MLWCSRLGAGHKSAGSGCWHGLEDVQPSGPSHGNPKYVFWNGTSLPSSATGLWQADLRQVMKDAGLWIKGNLSHRFRDTTVDFWLEQGCDMTTIAAMLGDTVRTVERHYADLASKRMGDRLSKLPTRSWGAEAGR